MPLTLSQIISRVNRKIQNAQSKLGGESEMIAIINEAQRALQLDVDFISAKRKGAPKYIMSGIFEYPVDSDLSYDKYIEAWFEDEHDDLMKSQFQRTPAKFFFNAQNPYLSNGYAGDYRGWSDGRSLQNPLGSDSFERLAIEFDNGNPYLMVRMKNGRPTATINACNSVTDNGTWVGSEDVKTVRTNNQSFREGSGSVEFLTYGDLDQSQTTQDTVIAVGEADVTTKYNRLAQSFVAGQNQIKGVSLYKGVDTGSFIGTVTVALYADSGADAPTGAALATNTLSNSEYLALENNKEFRVDFTSTYTATVGAKYWVVISTSTADNSNHPNLRVNSAGGYSNGSLKYNNSVDGWVAQTGDLYFKIHTGYTNAVLTNSTMTQVDISEYKNKGVFTLNLELPSTTPSLVKLAWGNGASNYWEATTTVQQNGLAFREGWNTLAFNWADATEVGNVDETKIDYLVVTVVNTNGVEATYRLDAITVRLTRQLSLQYYSKYLVVDVNGVRKADFTSTDDTTILQEKEVNMLVWKASSIAHKQLRQYNEAGIYEQELKAMLNEYKMQQPSQEEPVTNSYYII